MKKAKANFFFFFPKKIRKRRRRFLEGLRAAAAEGDDGCTLATQGGAEKNTCNSEYNDVLILYK
jgi:hypothetical protein